MAGRRNNKEGRCGWCKKCEVIRVAEWNKNNREKRRIIYARYNAKFPRRRWARASIGSHRQRGYKIDFNTKELWDLAEKTEECSYCGVKFIWNYQNTLHIPLPQSPTMDRKNNKLLLKTIDDIEILCHECNSTKRTRSKQEFIDYCKMIASKF